MGLHTTFALYLSLLLPYGAGAIERAFRARTAEESAGADGLQRADWPWSKRRGSQDSARDHSDDEGQRNPRRWRPHRGKEVALANLDHGLDHINGLEWVDPMDPGNTKTVENTALFEQKTKGVKRMSVPYTVWSFGEMSLAARTAFCSAARNWGASDAYIWNMTAVEHLLNRHPEWQEVWQKLPRTIMRSDIARYLVAYEHGGTYTDYDVVGRSPPPAEGRTTLVLQVEQTLERWQVSPRSVTGREKHFLQRIAQYFFAVEPKHLFFKMVLNEALQRISGLLAEGHKDWSDRWVLYSTGPDVITTVYHEHFESDRTVVLAPQDTIAKHLSLGGWKRGQDSTAARLNMQLENSTVEFLEDEDGAAPPAF